MSFFGEFFLKILIVLIVLHVIDSEQILASTSNVRVLLSDILFMEVVYPEPVRYTYKIRPAKDFGTVFPTRYHEIELTVAEPYHGCTALHNAEFIEDTIALLQRGECSFVTKTLNAQHAGAIAVLITDNDLNNDQHFIDMIDDNTSRPVQIPAAFLLGKDGHMIKQTLEALKLRSALINIPVNVTGVAVHQVNQPPWTLW